MNAGGQARRESTRSKTSVPKRQLRFRAADLSLRSIDFCTLSLKSFDDADEE